jgi:hypothetical protein
MRRASLASAIRNSQTILYGGKAIFVLILKMLFLLKEIASEVLILLIKINIIFLILICFLDR